MTSIFNMFARSPIKLLQKHMVVVGQCAATLAPFFEAVFVNDWEKAERLRHDITSLEHEADEIKRDVRLNVPHKLFMSVTRSDVLALVSLQDLIANRSKDISGVILGRHMQFPESLQPAMRTFLERSISAATQATQAINELDELQEAGFSGKEVKIIERMIQELARIEHETDELQITLRANIFQLERTLAPVDVMFLYKIIEWIGVLADQAQNVGDRLQMLIAS